MPMCTLEHQTPLYLYLWDIHYYKPQPLIELILHVPCPYIPVQKVEYVCELCLMNNKTTGEPDE